MQHIFIHSYSLSSEPRCSGSGIIFFKTFTGICCVAPEDRDNSQKKVVETGTESVFED